MHCIHCGNSNPSNASFCSACGKPIERDEPTMTLSVLDALEVPEAEEVESDLADLGSDDAMLVVRRGVNVGSRFLLADEVTTVGRHPNNGIFLDDVTVSRKHAEFAREGNSFIVRDVGSLNGTYVNNRSIDSCVLMNGDEVQIGAFKLLFLVGKS